MWNKSGSSLGSESRDINSESPVQNALEQVTGHLGDDVSCETGHGFAKEFLQITSGILNLVEDALNALPQTIKPLVEASGILVMLIAAFG